MKDNFSQHSDLYEKYRPIYPIEFYSYLIQQLNSRINAWDCGTGNGQVAVELSKHFETVFATDISSNQLAQAIRKDNIVYSIQPAEKTNFLDDTFDLIIVAQAIHWFDFEKFYSEAIRTAKDNAIIAVIGYGRLSISKNIDQIIDDFYFNMIGSFWNKERKYIDEEYQTIPFPFEEIPIPKFAINVSWNVEHLIGYINTWSAVKHFTNKQQYNPIDELKSEIVKHWDSNEVRPISFPLLCRIGLIKK
jgi:ubiquinone/menaquinone biosynthesis C-methylase UbiE